MHYREYFEDPPHYGTAPALPFFLSRLLSMFVLVLLVEDKVGARSKGFY
jgi:hypothetical protein